MSDRNQLSAVSGMLVGFCAGTVVRVSTKIREINLHFSRISPNLVSIMLTPINNF